MKPDALNRCLREVIGRCTPLSGEQLSAILFDTAYAVEASRFFTSVEAAITGDPRRLVRVRCEASAASEEAAEEAERIWETLASHAASRAHCVVADERQIVLTGVTETAEGGYATVQMMVTRR